MLRVILCFFFFFQAEDGIRDLTVTGVQTCALPIFAFRRRVGQVRKPSGDLRYQGRIDGRRDRRAVALADGLGCVAAGAGGPGPRSEEHTSELQSQSKLVCRLLLEKKKLPS